MIIYVQFSDATKTKIVTVFGGPQNPDDFDFLGEVEDDDPMYLDFINPQPSILEVQSAKLLALNQLASSQKTALASRVETLSDAVELEMATPAEIAELPIRKAQLVEWKRYAVFLGRVTSQEGWPPEVEWPVQPLSGMDLTVSSVEPSVVPLA